MVENNIQFKGVISSYEINKGCEEIKREVSRMDLKPYEETLKVVVAPTEKPDCENQSLYHRMERQRKWLDTLLDVDQLEKFHPQLNNKPFTRFIKEDIVPLAQGLVRDIEIFNKYEKDDTIKEIGVKLNLTIKKWII